MKTVLSLSAAARKPTPPKSTIERIAPKDLDPKKWEAIVKKVVAALGKDFSAAPSKQQGNIAVATAGVKSTFTVKVLTVNYTNKRLDAITIDLGTGKGRRVLIDDSFNLKCVNAVKAVNKAYPKAVEEALDARLASLKKVKAAKLQAQPKRVGGMLTNVKWAGERKKARLAKP